MRVPRSLREPILSVLAPSVIALTGSPGSAEAQIINVLRGFDAGEPGWSGGVEGTVAVAEGNTKFFEFQLDGAVQHQSSRNRWRLLARFMKRTAEGTDIAESRTGHLRHNYRIRPWLATVAFLQLQFNPFRRIDSRVLIGGGGRFDVVRNERWNAALGLTLMWEGERLTGETAHATTYRFSSFVSVYRDVDDGVDVDVYGFFQPAVDDLGDARALGVASLRVAVVGSLYLLGSYRYEYDSDPAPGVLRSDHLLRSGLGYDF